MWWHGFAGTAALWVGGIVAIRATLVPGEVCPDETTDGARSRAVAAAGWIDRAQKSDGSYVYEYDRDAKAEVPGYNVVRHAGVTMSLYQLAAAGEKEYLAPGSDGMRWMEARVERREDWAAIADDQGDFRLGANALMLAGLAFSRDATSDATKDDLMREIGRFIVAMQEPDGSFLDTWRAADPEPYAGLKSKYATGEAFWALALMHNRFPGEGWDVPTRRVADYLALHRDTVEGFEFPPWADQWAAYGLSEMVDWPLEDHHIPYARSLADRFGFLIRTEAQRRDNPWSKAIHGRHTRAAGMGTWVEGLDSLWRIADRDARMGDMRDDIGDRVACGAGMLAERQVPLRIGIVSEPRKLPDLEQGAWFTEGITRMDDQQHALSALIQAEAILQSRERGQ